MAILSDYAIGTVSIAVNGVVATGTGTAWNIQSFQEGDTLMVDGFVAVIAGPATTATSIPLTRPWLGGVKTNVPYRIRYMSDGSRYTNKAQELINLLGNGTLTALATIGSGINKLSYWTAAGVAALTDITTFGRAILALAGGTAGQFIRTTGTNTVVLQDIIGTVSQSSGVPTGAIIESGSNANGDYVKFADGTMMAWKQAQVDADYVAGANANGTWTLPVVFIGTPLCNINHRTVASVPVVLQAATTFGSCISPNGANTALYCTINGNSITMRVRIDLTAIGRWF